jgi:HK97 family phage portal protein
MADWLTYGPQEREATPQAHTPRVSIPPWPSYAAIIDEASARNIPAFVRALRLISGTIANLPLVSYRQDQPSPDQPRLIRQPEVDQTRWASINNTVEQLVLYGQAYWVITSLTSQGFPRTVKVLRRDQVQDNLPEHPDEVAVTLDDMVTRRYPKSSPETAGASVGEVICFTGWKGGVLEWGAKVLGTAAALEDAVQRYASTPMPTAVLKNSGADLDPEAVENLVGAYEKAREQRTTAYLNSVIDLQAVSWNSAEIQLIEARNQAALEIARLFSLDANWINANTPGGGSSLVYSNRIDMRADLKNFTLLDYCEQIGQRLSMRDCTPTYSSNLVAFDFTEFMRTTLEARTSIVTQLVPLNVISLEEARAFLQFSPDVVDSSPIGGIT